MGLCGPKEELMLSQEGYAVMLLPHGDGGPVLDLPVWKSGILCEIVDF